MIRSATFSTFALFALLGLAACGDSSNNSNASGSGGSGGSAGQPATSGGGAGTSGGASGSGGAGVAGSDRGSADETGGAGNGSSGTGGGPSDNAGAGGTGVVSVDAGGAGNDDTGGAVEGGAAGSTGSKDGGPVDAGRGPAVDAGQVVISPDGNPGLIASGGNPPKKVTTKGTNCGSSATWGSKSTQGMPDPSMTKMGNKYYAFGTGGGSVSSTDMITWTRGGSLFPSGLPAWTKYLSGPGLWAPDVHRVNGTYYAYYSISVWGNYNSSVGLATSPSAEGPWTDHGMVVDYKTGGSGVNVIDPDLFVDEDGTWWLIYGSYKSGLRIIQLDPKTGMALGGTPKPTLITKSLGEGSDVIKHNGWYYVFASRGKCCAGLQSTYQVVMGRSKTVTGPYLGTGGEQWVNSAYSVFLTGDGNHPGVGGQAFFRDDDNQLYMVYMAYTAPSGNAVLNVRPMWFDANDWPTLDPCKADTY